MTHRSRAQDTGVVARALAPMGRVGQMNRVGRVVGAWLVASALIGALPAQLSAQRAPRLSGVVFDSITKTPLRNALVQVIERDHPARSISARSDARGVFSFDTLNAGRYVVGFQHPRLDSLLLTTPVHTVELGGDGSAQVQLYVPTRHALAYALCGEAAHRDSTGLLVGHVRSAHAGGIVTNAQLRLQWSEFTIDSADGARTRFPTLLALTNRDGAFAVCGLPVNTRFLVQAWSASDTSGIVEIDMAGDGLATRDIYVGTFQRTMVAESEIVPATVTNTARKEPRGVDSAVARPPDSVTVVRGNGRLRGVILNDNLVPLANVRVTLRESGVVAMTNAAGLFTLQSLPTGSHLLEATAIGYAPSRISVDVTELSDGPVDVVLKKLTRGLDTLRVFASRGDRWMIGFNLRRQIGLGRFIDEGQIERMNPMMSADVLRLSPNVTIRRRSGSLHSVVLMRTGSAKELPDGAGTEAELCVPTLYVDGTPITAFDGDLEGIVTAREIRAMEVYRSAQLAPSDMPSRQRCGVLVVWTGMRKPLSPGRK